MVRVTDYEEAIRTRVCTACLERTGRGICSIGQSDDCALNRFLPDVIRMVTKTKSDSLDEHVNGLHVAICTQCKQTPDGKCEERDLQECALYEYLPLVIEAVEDVNAKHDKTKAGV